MPEPTIIIETLFEQDVRRGLTDFPKHLSSKYFYDKKGDKLFQDIMDMPEYYLTDREYEILSQNTAEIAELFALGIPKFKLLELGAGDGKKTKVLLKYLSENGFNFKYHPIDISQNALDGLEKSLRYELPKVSVETRQGTYFETLEEINAENGTKKVILFLGSNIGNLLHPQAVDFLKSVGELMQKEDLLFVGFDMKKNPQTVLDAYNDATGITAAFNKNVLHRINDELNGNFDVDKFRHWETYDPETGTAKSYLVAEEAQTVTLQKLKLQVEFEAWETIHTEISQKYDDRSITWLADTSGLDIVTEFSDARHDFKNYVFRRK
ncbi:MAG TPA: L-histidine N(alpha)-methyltransferase [Pricia sp.]|nr:L-histidine N(alpha)-methyltransferase [Pricia sp.]